jgi:hypothetical protein
MLVLPALVLTSFHATNRTCDHTIHRCERERGFVHAKRNAHVFENLLDTALAIVLGPDEIPVGENGCLARATRTRPSELVYRCACVTPGAIRKIARAKPIGRRIPRLLSK